MFTTTIIAGSEFVLGVLLFVLKSTKIKQMYVCMYVYRYNTTLETSKTYNKQMHLTTCTEVSLYIYVLVLVHI